MRTDARAARRSGTKAGPGEVRSEFERDRDRLLWSSAFRRLAAVTQVASAHEGLVFHNRLLHTLKVAHIGRGLAQLAKKNQPKLCEKLGGVDPDVVEAAGIAHDLGHPPFGHEAERELDRLSREAGLTDGFEGNAQSFRIVTKLEVRREGEDGLDLTRATINATLKYPWVREAPVGDPPSLKGRKFGAYTSESEQLEWARSGLLRPDSRSLEADLMDWADDIAYSVHDVEDFFRAGLIPLDLLTREKEERQRFADRAVQHWEKQGRHPDFKREDVEARLHELLLLIDITRPFNESSQHVATLQRAAATLVDRYCSAKELCDPTAPDEKKFKFRAGQEPLELEVEILKELTWHYVIHSPRLALQHTGVRELIARLFRTFHAAAKDGDFYLFDPKTQERKDALLSQGDPATSRVRLVVDHIAQLSESEAVQLHSRITGASIGSILDNLRR